MGLAEMLQRKDQSHDRENELGSGALSPAAPGVTFVRSDSHSQEIIHPPSFDEKLLSAADQRGRGAGLLAGLRAHTSRSRSRSRSRDGHRLSRLLGRRRSSDNLPADLPDMPAVQPVDADPAVRDASEARWEARAALLARENSSRRSSCSVVLASPPTLPPMASMPSSPPAVSSPLVDDDIQEAIRLHEAGDLARSTRLFGRLADPHGANNPLSQVLYGLALRHGWGCTPNPAKAVNYLSAAAASSAAIEQLALKAGLNQGGAAKGELVLAIFELANCFRNGWGLAEDPVAAKQYYETAANLGDTDAMNEAAWCYLEGFGCKKDKLAAARYYRMAEDHGNKTLGNSWIWKDKYNPASSPSHK